MVKFVDFIESFEWKIQLFFMDEFEPKTEMQAILNVLIIKPFKYLFGLLFIIVSLGYLMSGFGLLFIIYAIINKYYFLAALGIIFDLIYLAKYICLQILIFREKQRDNLLD